MLTALQSRAARLMAANRSESSYFAGGTVLNEHTARLSDDLDIFHDTEDAIEDACRKDILALERDGLEVVVDLDVRGCVEARVRDERRMETIVQWMPETRMRFFPLVPDPLWGLRLHKSDLAVNKTIAASSRFKTRDMVDMVLIRKTFCPLGPLFLAASIKLGKLAPLALVDMARQRAAGTRNDELEEMRTVLGGMDPGDTKKSAFDALDAAEEFLTHLPDPMLGGLPVNRDGIPVDRIKDMAGLRLMVDGGGRFPDFPDAPPNFDEGEPTGIGP